jgi:hypothetical protein
MRVEVRSADGMFRLFLGLFHRDKCFIEDNPNWSNRLTDLSTFKSTSAIAFFWSAVLLEAYCEPWKQQSSVHVSQRVISHGARELKRSPHGGGHNVVEWNFQGVGLVP